MHLTDKEYHYTFKKIKILRAKNLEDAYLNYHNTNAFCLYNTESGCAVELFQFYKRVYSFLASDDD